MRLWLPVLLLVGCHQHSSTSKPDLSELPDAAPPDDLSMMSGCPAGQHDDGKGGCSDDPCLPNPCSAPDQICVAGVCQCAAGLHDEKGSCVADTSCSPTSCNGHGTCMDGDKHVACECDAGWSGMACASCDSAYHDDGMGNCTQDRCLPNPCKDDHRSICTLGASGDPECGCDAGYHLDGAGCVVDESCQPSTCSGHGACSLADGRTRCTCTAGYLGASCAACDGGYHDDGMGGCTQDPCLPNPCSAPNQNVCSGGLCSCNGGFHDDGANGCTQDPCTPNPCLASNQACRVNGTAPECYTPPCDDQNPCTDDAVLGGGCTHTPRGNGTSCTTSLCLVGETCTGIVCGGGSARNCDDANTCTADSCSLVAGCQHANDNNLIPSDGIACTVDKCTAGVASHTPDNASCDDGLWCTGSEVCDGGCKHTAVPQPPIGLGPCQVAGACSEDSHTFAVSLKPLGTSCSDGLECSTGDQCDGHGACRGAAIAGCAEAGSCNATTPLMTSIDVPWGELRGTMTIGGADLPESFSDYGNANFYLIAKDTGALHFIGGIHYSWNSGYKLDSHTYSARVVTGVYDLLYQRSCSPPSSCNDKSDPSLGPFVNGYRVLQKNVVIGPGSNLVDIDIPTTEITGTLTIGGADLPETFGDYGNANFYLIAKDTGALHFIGAIHYSWNNGYKLDSHTYSARVIPGVYDLLYQRSCSPPSSCNDKSDPSLGPFVNGYRVLQANLTVAGASQKVDIDIPTLDLGGRITMGGNELPETFSDYGNANFYLVAKDTGALHFIGAIHYSWNNGYKLDSHSYSARVIPGVYDLLYQRSCSPPSSCNDKSDDSLGPYVNGYRVLKSNLTISGATLDIDVPTLELTGRMTIGGADLPETFSDYGNANFYLIAKDTGALHFIGAIHYSWNNGYKLDSHSYSARVIPGVYDVLYQRSCSPPSSCNDKSDPSLGPYVNGYRILKTVTLSNSQTLDLDIPTAELTGTLTIGGLALPETFNDYGNANLYLVARDTGAQHFIGGIHYSWNNGYKLDSHSYSARVIPGVYDLLYQRSCSPPSSCNDKSDPSLGPYVNGYRMLKRGITVSGGTLDIDIPTKDLTGTITVAGAPLPPRYTDYGNANFYLLARDTRALHYVAGIHYSWNNGYVLDGDSWSARVIPGIYDLLYQRSCSPPSSCNCKSDPSLGPFVNGYRILSACTLTSP